MSRTTGHTPGRVTERVIIVGSDHGAAECVVTEKHEIDAAYPGSARCVTCKEWWPCRPVLSAENAKLRTALEGLLVGDRPDLGFAGNIESLALNGAKSHAHQKVRDAFNIARAALGATEAKECGCPYHDFQNGIEMTCDKKAEG